MQGSKAGYDNARQDSAKQVFLAGVNFRMFNLNNTDVSEIASTNCAVKYVKKF